MRSSNFAKIALGIIFSITAFKVFPADLDTRNYAAYESVLSNGERILYVVAKEKIAILHSEIATPIKFTPKIPGFRIAINSSGNVTHIATIDGYNSKNISAACLSQFGAACSLTTQQIFSGDFDGDGQREMVFHRNGRINIIKEQNGTASLFASLSPTQGGQISAISDTNEDNLADIDIASANYRYINSGNGQFTTETMPDFTNTNLIGAIAGAFRVNEQGAATYNIPIMTFAGTAGVAPQLSLNYNSQNGSGIAGVGWSLSGLSSISRCRQTEAQDANALPLTFNQNDRFCLDGQRLIVTAGTYGSPGSTYRTEIDSGVEVTAKGGSAGNPDYFEATGKDGSLSQYGNGSNSKQMAGSATLTWGINQFADSVGNPIKFQYFNDADGFRPSRIDYAFGANRSAQTSGTYVAFTYRNRPDKHVSYINAARLANNKRLSKIETFNDGVSLRTYNLQYAATQTQHGTNQIVFATQSLLEALYECVGHECLKPTRFEWLARAGNTINWNSRADLTLENEDYQGVTSWKPLDFNGDGITDLAAVVTGYRTSNGHMFYTWVYLYQGQAGGGYARYTAYANPSGGTPFKMEILDYNADGRHDVALWDNSSWKILLAKPVAEGGWRAGNGNATFDVDTGITSNQVTFIDIDSNGLTDAIYPGDMNTSFVIRRLIRDETKPVSSPLRYRLEAPITPTGLPPAQDYGGCTPLGDFCGFYSSGGATLSFNEVGALSTADINSDGRLDLLTFSAPLTGSPTYYAYTINDNNSVSTLSAPQKFSWELATSAYSGAPQMFDDINGDGAPDWLMISGNSGDYRTWRYVIQGKHWGSASSELLVAHKDAPPQMVDYNRDGFLDIVWHDVAAKAIRVKFWSNASEAFSSEAVITSTDGNIRNQHLLMDLNGDGGLEYIASSDGKISIYSNHQLGVDSVLTKIDNGMGNQTDISYERISNRSEHYVGMDKRVAYEQSFQEACVYDTYCFSYPITSVNASGYYTALNSDWDYDLTDAYENSGLSAAYIAKSPSSPVFEFTAPVQIVTEIASSAPTASSTSAKSRISYRYSEAKIQAKGRGLLGFRSITLIDEQSGVRTSTRYRQDFPFTGSPLLTEVRTAGTTADPDGKLIKRSLNDYGYVATNGADNTKRYQIWARNVIETSYELSGAETSHLVTSSAQPDSWGNTTNTTVSTYSAGDHTNYLTQVSTSNIYNGGVNGVRYGRLSSSAATHRRAGEPDVTKTSSFTYYTSGSSTNLLQTETIDAGADGAPAVTTTYNYDNFGNKTRAIVAATGEVSRQTDWLYSLDGRYLESTTNALGHITEQVALRNEYGNPTRIEGLNGYWSEIEYDSQGRETRRTDATGAWQSTTYSMSDLGMVAGAIYRITRDVAGGGSSTEYFDVLGRSIARSVIGFDGTPSWTRTDYDSSGRIKRQSEPYWNGQLEQWTVNEYDELGRLKTQTAPDNSVSGVTYNGLEIIYINSLNQQRIERRNAAGELIEVQDHLGGKINNAYTTTGQLKSASVTADGKTIATEMSYNSRGQKTRMFDPDKGTWFYEYTGFGELKYQYKVTSTVEYTNTLANLKNNNSLFQRTYMVYDMLGRMTQRSDYKQNNVLEGTATWSYDTATNGLGKLATESGGGITKTYYYGAYSGAAGRTDIVVLDGGITAQTSITYDAIGRPWKQIDALHLNSGTENIYNPYGYLDTVKDLESNAPVYNAEESDVRGNITRAILLGGETVERSYDATTGRLQVIKSSTLTGNGDVQNLSYSWDTAGNMTSRNDLKHAQQQSFCYDALNRLIKSHNNLTGSCSLALADQDQEYDGFGNITRKTGVGAYAYNANLRRRPHAVTNAGGTVYTYDNNGNVVSDTSGRTFTYATFDLPTKIVKSTQQVEFSYGADRSRWKRVDTDSFGTATTTWYLGNIEKVQLGGIVRYKRTVAGVAIFNYDSNKSLTERLTTFTDALGSVVATRNIATGAINGMAFNPWGERVMANNYGDIVDGSQLTPYLSVLSVPTTRGFTGHEMVDSMGIVHMNGRIFDSRLGRFLQADPIIQAAGDVQSYNRYTYVRNNPLTLVDPSGYSWIKKRFNKHRDWHDKAHKFSPSFQSSADLLDAHFGIHDFNRKHIPFVNSVDNYIATHQWVNYAGTAIGAFFYYVPYVGMAISAHISYAQGASSDQIVSSAAISYGMSYIPIFIDIPYVGGIIQSAVIGGTSSWLSGGKFANGAMGAVFGYAIGALAQSAATAGSFGSDSEGDWLTGYELPEGFYDNKVAWGWGDPINQNVVDTFTGFGDTFGAGYIRNALGIDGGVNYNSRYYLGGQVIGTVTPGLGTAVTLRGAAYLGGSYKWLNQGRYWRIGPSTISKSVGKTKPFSYGAGRDIPMLRIGNQPPNAINHIDLRILGK